ncbi:hypothetical protein ZOSMA_38G00490 [Zostera marina]|uniref:DUF7722 domain-containing protein n=1 Tax=Zostera marina TaxID=29655 RepID=A0A0K9P4G5_ZOSMR|nr:hypothetical protein ZOSMA_38G00490 [Zostera marina]
MDFVVAAVRRCFPGTARVANERKQERGAAVLLQKRDGEEKGESTEFQMPLHYPRFNRRDYENMPEWKVDNLLKEYGLPTTGDLACKRELAMGAFLWPSH